MVAGGRRDRSGTPPEARIVVLGDRNVEYLTHRELDGALGLFPDWASADWVATDSSEARALGDIDGLWLVPGSPYRDARSVCAAIKYAQLVGQSIVTSRSVPQSIAQIFSPMAGQ